MEKRNNISRKETGQQDMIAFDNPDDTLDDIPKQQQGDDRSLVAVDNPDDFEDEGDV
jgi:hypothetical protein